MKLPRIASFLFALSLFNYIAAQPTIAYQQCYGTSGSDVFRDAIVTNDGGFAAVAEFGGTDGFMSDQDSLLYPATVMKFNSAYELEWVNNFGGNTYGSGFQKLLQLDNSDFILAGAAGDTDGDFSNNHGSLDFMIVKTDQFGIKKLSKCYGSPGYEEMESISKTQDGGLIITGKSNSAGGDIPFHYGIGISYDAIVMKLDTSGNVIWLRDLGGTGDDSPMGEVTEFERGYYIIHIASHSEDYDLADSPIIGDKRWIIKMDSLGNIVDENFVSGTIDLYTYVGDQIINYNNQMFVIGASNPSTSSFPGVSGYGDVFDGGVGVFDINLNFVDLHVYGGTFNDNLKRAVFNADGSFYFLGYSNSLDFDLPGNYNNGAASDYWLMKTDINFIPVWSKNFGGSDPCGDLGCSNFQGNLLLQDGKLIAFIKVMVPESFPDFDISCDAIGPGESDAWLVVFDLPNPVSEVENHSNFSIHPNPSNNYIAIENPSEIENLTCKIFDLFGRQVINDFQINTQNMNVDLSKLSSGFYILYIFQNNSVVYSNELIIQK